jgi:hypothetical protein
MLFHAMLPKAMALAAGLALAATPAAAVTVKNTSSKDITIGIDHGNNEKVETVGAGKSVNVECKETCGLTGPWGFSWMAKGDETISTNGESLVTVK